MIVYVECYPKIVYYYAVLGIRILIGFGVRWLSGSGSGSRKAKMSHKKENNVLKCCTFSYTEVVKSSHFWSKKPGYGFGSARFLGILIIWDTEL
jgi:hypothetical protein